MRGETANESRVLAAGNVFSKNYSNGVVFPVPGRMRKNISSEATTMIYVVAIVSLFLFVYLFTALIRPEWF
jgi:K+-transporting ATPase KdpF subunit